MKTPGTTTTTTPWSTLGVLMPRVTGAVSHCTVTPPVIRGAVPAQRELDSNDRLREPPSPKCLLQGLLSRTSHISYT
jgi:hypothetical protein